MLVLNCTDDRIIGKFSEVPPVVSRGQETHIPARSFIFEPGRVTLGATGKPQIDPASLLEVSEDAGTHLLQKFGPRGLRQVRLGDDLMEVRQMGRRELYRHCCQQIERYQQENAGRAGQGLPPLIAGDHLYAARKTKRQLEAEFGDDFADEPIPAFAKGDGGPNLTDEQRLIINQRRGTLDDIAREKAAGGPIA